MKYYLLTGAGFSRNWGGWLANEAFEYLLGKNIDTTTRRILWENKMRGLGFEGALADIRHFAETHPTDENRARFETITDAVVDMFHTMNSNFAKQTFDFGADRRTRFSDILPYFDAIFTLNQDLLIEQFYAGLSPSRGDWTGTYIPLMTGSHFRPNGSRIEYIQEMVPDTQPFDRVNCQPYYKLHGSANWRSEDGLLLVVGGDKPRMIASSPVLSQYHRDFADSLNQGGLLMVIGYSFCDKHINDHICNAIEHHGLKLFIIDPAGVDVLENIDRLGTPTPLSEIRMSVVGASRRPLRSTFTEDSIERSKIQRAFDMQVLLARQRGKHEEAARRREMKRQDNV